MPAAVADQIVAMPPHAAITRKQDEPPSKQDCAPKGALPFCADARAGYFAGAGGATSTSLPENTTGPVGAPVGEPPTGSTETAKVAALMVSWS